MSALKIEKLNKSYEKFKLKDVSFTLDEGYIMGFIGSNGAGKTTTIKSILKIVHADSGYVEVLGEPYSENELKLKQDIGYILGGADYYPKLKLKDITDVAKRFYDNWDSDLYKKYIKRFDLDESKKTEELSQGMRIKYALTIALSHHAKLYILDEPTSGLDPVARNELLDIFHELIEAGDKSILFSTHITSDLEKCADYITYIIDGKIVASDTKDDLINSFRLVNGSKEQLKTVEHDLIGYKTNSFGFTGLIAAADLPPSSALNIALPNLEEIMIYHENKDD
jgi:ABC-2 type transport system ATP-binding protein